MDVVDIIAALEHERDQLVSENGNLKAQIRVRCAAACLFRAWQRRSM